MPQTPILVCFAVKEEARPFQRLVAGRKNLHVLLAGMGRRNAESAAKQALDSVRPGLVFTCGFAGGLNPELKTGEVLYQADEAFALTRALVASGARAARFFCAPSVAVTVGEKQELWKKTGADAVEMESEPIRELCWKRGIPSATVRAISDAANENLPLNFNQLMTPDMRMDFGKLALALVRSPGKTAELMRFQKKVSAAATRLGATLAAALNSPGLL